MKTIDYLIIYTMQIIEFIPADEFYQENKTEDTILIDIRTLNEQQHHGYIEGTNMLLDVYEEDFFDRFMSLDRDKKYLIYCWHASRTAYLLQLMKQYNFTYVKDLRGGTEQWESLGYKLIKD